MARTKKITDKDWLNSEPPQSEIELTKFGGYHIPIEKLRPLLDRLNANVKNYRFSYYKDGYASLSAAGSLELTVWIDGNERTVTGAYNLNLTDAPSGFWNGTLKSECVKNAALELGKRFGRELNKNVPQPDSQSQSTIAPPVKQKPKPDSKVMAQFKVAVERGDEAAIRTLESIYEIKTEKDGTD